MVDKHWSRFGHLCKRNTCFRGWHWHPSLVRYTPTSRTRAFAVQLFYLYQRGQFLLVLLSSTICSASPVSFSQISSYQISRCFPSLRHGSLLFIVFFLIPWWRRNMKCHRKIIGGPFTRITRSPETVLINWYKLNATNQPVFTRELFREEQLTLTYNVSFVRSIFDKLIVQFEHCRICRKIYSYGWTDYRLQFTRFALSISIAYSTSIVSLI